MTTTSAVKASIKIGGMGVRREVKCDVTHTPGLDSCLQPDDDMPAEFYELVGECAAEIETDLDRVSCLLDASVFCFP